MSSSNNRNSSNLELYYTTYVKWKSKADEGLPRGTLVNALINSDKECFYFTTLTLVRKKLNYESKGSLNPYNFIL